MVIRRTADLARSIPVLAILTSLILCGCGIPEQLAAQQDLNQSQAVYARCVATSGDDSGQCQAAEGNVELNQRTYDQTSSGVWLGPQQLRPRLSPNPGSTNPDNSNPYE